MLAHKRKTGELGRLRPLPWALVIAALFVLLSRIGNLQPGYLYGIVLGAIFVKDVDDKEEGRETFYGSLWTLVAAFVAWLGLTWARSLGYRPERLRHHAPVDGVRGDPRGRPRGDRVRPDAAPVHARPHGLQVEPRSAGRCSSG